MAIFDVSGSDSLGLGDNTVTAGINPKRLDRIDTMDMRDNSPVATLKVSPNRIPLVTDSISFNDNPFDFDAGRFASYFRLMGFNKTDSISLADSSTRKFPTYLQASDTIEIAFPGEPFGSIEDDDLDTWVHFSTRAFSGSDTLILADSSVLNFGFFDVGNQTDTFYLADLGTIELFNGPFDRIVSETISLTDSSTVSKSKGKTDYVILTDIACVCVQPNRSDSNTIHMSDYATLRVQGRLIPPPGGLPGTGGASFKLILRKSLSERITMLEGFQAYLNDELIVAATCCNGGIVVVTAGWAALTGWTGLSGWSDLGE